MTDVDSPAPEPTPSKKYQLTREDLPKILKSLGVGSALAVVTFVGTFLMTSIDWGALAALVTVVVPPAITTVRQWLEGKND